MYDKEFIKSLVQTSTGRSCDVVEYATVQRALGGTTNTQMFDPNPNIMYFGSLTFRDTTSNANKATSQSRLDMTTVSGAGRLYTRVAGDVTDSYNVSIPFTVFINLVDACTVDGIISVEFTGYKITLL